MDNYLTLVATSQEPDEAQAEIEGVEMPALSVLKILIAEDHELARTGLVYALEGNPKFKVVAETGDGAHAVELTRETAPDIILMDIEMPILDGISATRQIKEQFPDTKVVILTSQYKHEMIFASLAAGAEAYCMKDIRIEQLFIVMEMVAEGGIWLDPAIAKLVMGALPKGDGKQDATKPHHKPQAYSINLTDREMSVLEQLVEGKTNKEIALALEISTHTVKSYVCNIIQKLSVDDRTQAAVKALKEGLVPFGKSGP